MTRYLIALALVSSLALPLWAGDPTPAYPDTADGLKKLAEDLLAASKAGEKDKVSTLVKGFVLPGHEAWFKKVFGDEKGTKLAEMYAKILPKIEAELTKAFEERVAKGQTEVKVFKIEKADDPNATGAQKDALAAMKSPVPLYTLKMAKAGEESGFSMWSFVYVDGGFRFGTKMKEAK